eukprot:Skav226332  [mRNA]  locus=scaffold4486:83254:89140:+ [translate_table: standard]
MMSATSVVTFFTDGGATNPCDSQARLAAYAVVQDVMGGIDEFQMMHSAAFCTPPKFPSFRVLTSGFVQGSQTAARGEMFAFLRALQAAETMPDNMTVHFVTDAKYVHDLQEKLNGNSHFMMGSDTSNADIIQQITMLWRPDRYCLRKVKSHQSLQDVSTMAQLYDVMGNMCVDKAVTCVLQHSVRPLTAMANEIYEFNKLEKEQLTKVCQYVIALNRQRLQLQEQCPDAHTQADNQSSLTDNPMDVMPRSLMREDACAFLSEFSPPAYRLFLDNVEWEQEHLQACQQGATLALAAIQWAMSLRWPVDIRDSYNDSSDWGVSWLELFVDFQERLSGVMGADVALTMVEKEPDTEVQENSFRYLTSLEEESQKGKNEAIFGSLASHESPGRMALGHVDQLQA